VGEKDGIDPKRAAVTGCFAGGDKGPRFIERAFESLETPECKEL
jgi:hypothetical protein